MRKFLPFIFPLIALLIVLFLAVRWYNTKTSHGSDQIADFGDNIKVEDLSQLGSKNQVPQMAKDVKTVELKGTNAQGQVRYEVTNGTLDFTVNADLVPPTQNTFYQVWLKQTNGDGRKKAFVLIVGKGGYMGSGKVSGSSLPIDIVVTKKNQNDDALGDVILSGQIPAESTR